MFMSLEHTRFSAASKLGIFTYKKLITAHKI